MYSNNNISDNASQLMYKASQQVIYPNDHQNYNLPNNKNVQLVSSPSQIPSNYDNNNNNIEFWNNRSHMNTLQRNPNNSNNYYYNDDDNESVSSNTTTTSIASSYAVEIPEIPSPFIADVIDDKNHVLAFTPLPKQRIKRPKKPSSPSNNNNNESPLSKRNKRNILVKDIFTTPSKIVNYDLHVDDMFFSHHINDPEKLKEREIFEKKHKIWPVWTIAKRHNLIEETPYRKLIGSDIRKIKPVKHTTRKRHIVHRSNMEEALFHDVNKPRLIDGRTPLYLAAMEGHTKSVRCLYHYGAKINQRIRGKYSWEYGKSPLYIAAEKGHLLTAKAIIKLDAKIDLPDHRGRTPLYAAAETGQEHMVHLLVHFGGADVNSEGNEGESPLFAAALNGHFKVVVELLDMGADVNHQRHDGWSPVHAAAYGGHILCIRKLCDYGANVNVATVGHRTALAIAENKAADLLFTNEAEIRKGVVKILQAYGAVATPVYVQMRKACEKGDSKKILELIHVNHADVNLTRQDGVSPIWIAAQHGHYDCIKALIDNGANVHQATLYGDTALTIAMQEGHFQIARTLREMGANGWNYAHIACEDGDADLIYKLSKLTGDEYVDLNRPDDDGWSPAHVAVNNHNYEALLALSSVGADLNQPDLIIKGKQTPLDIAKYKSCVEGVDKWKSIVDLLKEFSFMETRETEEKRAEKMAAYVIQRIYRLHRRFVASQMKLEKQMEEKRTTKSVIKKEIGSNENWKFIAPLNKKKDFRYEPINEILDISHDHLTVETKNFAGTPRKKGEKIVYQNKFKEKYGIVD